jgi:beta-lactamase superfamily II metal-dependent hydrolase
MPSTRLLLSIVLLTSCQLATRAQSVGQPLAMWQPGNLDIHHISTGRGNATFFVFPDSTTLLIDAGAISPLDWRTGKPRTLPTLPDTSRRAGEWIARYIRRTLRFAPNPVIDYAVMTHFHDDHIGSPVLAPRKPGADYALTGITEVAEYVPIRKLLDRGWPDYAYPRPLDGDSMVANYRRFLNWQRREKQLTVERFRAGRADQIRLLHQPKRYQKIVEVRNLAVNGEVWTGTGDEAKARFPASPADSDARFPNENGCSIALRIRYGRFDYFTAGDIPGVLRFGEPAWHDLETPIAKITGPVDVQLLDHHGYEDSQNGSLLAALRPRVLVIPAWDGSHPARSVLERITSEASYPGKRAIFTTSLLPQTATTLGELRQKLSSEQGHVVVRVWPGGASYSVLIVDDRDESGRVKAVHGPYRAR